MIKVTFLSRVKVAKDLYSFHFMPSSKVRYIAGQFIELTIPHSGSDDRGQKRWFTLSSSPTESDLVITTKIIRPRASSFKRTLYELTPGTVLRMASPMGDFVLPKDKTIPLIFVAGGIGCTPFRSILKSLQDSHESRDIRMLYALSDPTEQAFSDVFDYLGPRFKSLNTSVNGKLDASAILEFSANKEGCYYYISGPEPLVEALEKSLISTGVEKSRIHGDLFPGYTSA